jgi:hypothetical protein
MLVGLGGYEVIQLIAPTVFAASPNRPLLYGAVLSLIASHLAFPSRRLEGLAARVRVFRVPSLSA